MKETGKILKENRERLGYSINEISIETKISPRILRAIEDNVEGDLPPRTFLRGFIQTYAKYLKIDAQVVLDSFNKEHSIDREVHEIDEPTINEEDVISKVNVLNDRALTTKILTIAGIILLIFIIIGIKSIVEKYENESVVPKEANVIETIKEEPAPTEKKEPTVVEETVDATPSKEIIKDVPKKDNSILEEKTTSEISNNEVKSEETKSDVAKKQDETPQEEQTVTVDKPQEIIIEALDAIKIDFRVDGGTLQSLELQPEQVHTIKAKSKVAIDFSDGGLVNIIHNGKDLGVPGDLGKSIKVKFPR